MTTFSRAVSPSARRQRRPPRRPRTCAALPQSHLLAGVMSTTPEPLVPKVGESPRLGNVNVVEAVDLRRTYRITTGTLRRRSRDVEAVRGVSFSIREGELFGLLGPNGAGKTTTIKMLNTLLIPTAGQRARARLRRRPRRPARARADRLRLRRRPRPLRAALRARQPALLRRALRRRAAAAAGAHRGAARRSSGSRAARASASRATAAACASGSTSRAASCTTRPSSSSTSRRSASTRSARASSAR